MEIAFGHVIATVISLLTLMGLVGIIMSILTESEGKAGYRIYRD